MTNLPLTAIANISGSKVPNLLVKDVINSETRTWNLNAIDNYISEQLAEEIRAIPIGSRNNEDQLVWSHGKGGDITIK